MYGSNIIKGDATMHQETELIIPDYDPYNYYCVGTSRRSLHNWRRSVIKTRGWTLALIGSICTIPLGLGIVAVVLLVQSKNDFIKTHKIQ